LRHVLGSLRRCAPKLVPIGSSIKKGTQYFGNFMDGPRFSIPSRWNADAKTNSPNCLTEYHVIRRTQRRSMASISAFKSPDRERHSQVAAVAHFCRSSAGHEGASAHISLPRTRAYRCAGLQHSPSSVRRVRTDGYCQEWHVAGRWA